MRSIGQCLGAAAYIARLFLIVSICLISHARAWTVQPSYESPPGDTSLNIINEKGQSAEIYSESHAILIVQANYKYNATFPSAPEAARKAINLLRPKLEADRFHVLIWMDLNSEQLKKTIDEIFGKYGYNPRGRMFFYYFGHGDVTGEEDTRRAWLVPVDAPDPVEKEMKFYRLAVSMSEIVEKAKQALIKHAFFAFEACQAGYVIRSLSTMGDLEPPHIKGYVLSAETQRPVKQFLTAGNMLQRVPANNSFTALLAGALVDPAADSNGDGFITGKKIMSYVALRLPQWATAYHQQPEIGSYPPVEGGDMVFGPTASYTPIGCYADRGDIVGTTGRDLDGANLQQSDMTTEKCVAYCASRGFSYAATQFGKWCFCGRSYGKFGSTPDKCSTPCAGNEHEICGGFWANNVYVRSRDLPNLPEFRRPTGK